MLMLSRLRLLIKWKAAGKWSSLHYVVQLIRPRAPLFAFGFVLLLISRATGLILPYSVKMFGDLVAGRPVSHWTIPNFVKMSFIYLHAECGVSLLALIIMALILATVIQATTSFALTQLLSKEGHRAICDLRQKIQIHISRLPVSYFDTSKTGSLASRVMTDVEGIRNLIGTGFIDLVGGIVTTLIVFGFLFYKNYTIATVGLAFLASLWIWVRRTFKMMRPLFRERSQLTAQVMGRLTESLGGIRVIKGYHAEEREQEVFAVGAHKLLQNVVRILNTTSILNLVTTLVLGLMDALILSLAVRQILLGKWDAFDLLQYTMFLGFLVAPVFQINNIGTQLTEAFAGLDRTREVLSEQPEDADPKRRIILPPLEGHLRFENVSFSYPTGKPVLEEINFEAVPGTVTAFVGSSGSGKSTIIGLIAAFYKPSSGRILIDGVDLDTVRLDSYRPSLGVVLQESFLFDGTIRENVAYACPHASVEEIVRACRIAHVNEFAERFPEKYETVVGERGVKLSGGQRQRISIARAVLADPKLLILDEATSNLDTVSETFIQEGLKYLMKGRTTFVIAHRLSTVRQADQILVLEGGRILESGTHQSLYTAGGRYYELHQHGIESTILAPQPENSSSNPELLSA